MKAVHMRRETIQSRLNIYGVLVYTYIETEQNVFMHVQVGIIAKYI